MSRYAMASLGLSSLEEDIYRHFLRHPGTSVDDLHVRLRSDRVTADQALARLSELRLVRTTGGTVTVTEPDLVVSRLAEDQMEQLHQAMRKLTHTRPILESLRREAPPAATAGPALGIERMEDLALVRNRIDDLSFFARQEVMSAEPYDALSPENIAHARPLDLRCLRRGVVIRNLVRRAALDDPPTRDYLRELTAHGARIRVADDFSELILIYDRHTALVPVDPHDTARGALCAREDGLVGNIITLFERLWDAAHDFGALVNTKKPEPHPLTPAQLEALRSMCTVSKDETGAREMGISLRTYRRHISDLLQLLGADNRAHAALLARERGWI
ncbi:helix-turn-helix transcriptional regulator [Streptomyces otsuchiensis]|uniref:helix-turn-helix transcriptional regulator n=1 Tax=Streptomyces otsuchiensis TaxID=2681388 RepID=UPI003F68ACD0